MLHRNSGKYAIVPCFSDLPASLASPYHRRGNLIYYQGDRIYYDKNWGNSIFIIPYEIFQSIALSGECSDKEGIDCLRIPFDVKAFLNPLTSCTTDYTNLFRTEFGRPDALCLVTSDTLNFAFRSAQKLPRRISRFCKEAFVDEDVVQTIYNYVNACDCVEHYNSEMCDYINYGDIPYHVYETIQYQENKPTRDQVLAQIAEKKELYIEIKQTIGKEQYDKCMSILTAAINKYLIAKQFELYPELALDKEEEQNPGDDDLDP